MVAPCAHHFEAAAYRIEAQDPSRACELRSLARRWGYGGRKGRSARRRLRRFPLVIVVTYEDLVDRIPTRGLG
jgi:hypothetical protein